MTYKPDIHHRRSIRLQEYDYSGQGAYFVTLCTKNMEPLFGSIEDGNMKLNDAGQVVRDAWIKIPLNKDNIMLDEWVIMPDHFHGIVLFTDYVCGPKHGPVGAIHELPLQQNKLPLQQNKLPLQQNKLSMKQYRRKMGLPLIIGRFKMNTSKQINIMRNTKGTPVWQRNYFERIIRDEYELNRVRQYIIDNPKKWRLTKKN